MEYELVHEIQNLCRNNQMRDVFFHEIECDDPIAWVQQHLKGKAVGISEDRHSDGSITIYCSCDGLTQKFVFTPF